MSTDPENFVFWKGYHLRSHRKLRRVLTRELRAEVRTDNPQMLKTEALVAENRLRQVEARVQELEEKLRTESH